MYFGIPDPWVAAAFLLCILSSLLCLVWGIVRWNREEPSVDEPPAEIMHWVEEEEKLEEEL